MSAKARPSFEESEGLLGPPAVSPSKSGLAWLETLLLTAALPSFGYWLGQDPWILRGTFSWLAIAPLLAGLRYGFAHGFGSALLLSASMGMGWRLGVLPSLPLPSSLGLLVVGMLAGEFCDMWRRRLDRLRIETEYRRVRLDEFTHNFHLLKVSHDRLERQLAGSADSLRDALTNLQRTLAVTVAGDGPLAGMEGRILEVFANHGWLQVASLFAVDEERRIGPPLARLGEPAPVVIDDPLVVRALQSGHLMSVRAHTAPESRLLAVVPMTDSFGRVRALLAIEEMLFIAFHDDNLKLLSVLGAHIGDALAAGPALLDKEGGAERDFLWDLRRGIEDRRRFNLPFTLAGMAVPPGRQGDELIDIVVGQRRALDRVLIEEASDGTRAVMVLLPVTDRRGVDGYLKRIEGQLQARRGVALAEAAVRIDLKTLEKGDRADVVLGEMRVFCGRNAIPDLSRLRA